MVHVSQPAWRAIGRLLVDQHEALAREWSVALGDRLTASPAVPRETIEREFRLVLAALTEMVGPFREEVKPLWRDLAELYGRSAAARGLAAGEVVDEFQHLRELLTIRLAPAVAALRPRLALAVLLRLNRILDHALATAVAGYTDALVATLFAQGGVPGRDGESEAGDLARGLEAIERHLAELRARR